MRCLGVAGFDDRLFRPQGSAATGGRWACWNCVRTANAATATCRRTAGGADLFIRMHVLCGLRRRCVGRALSQLRRRTGAPAVRPAETGALPRIDGAQGEGGRLRHGLDSRANGGKTRGCLDPPGGFTPTPPAKAKPLQSIRLEWLDGRGTVRRRPCRTGAGGSCTDAAAQSPPIQPSKKGSKSLPLRRGGFRPWRGSKGQRPLVGFQGQEADLASLIRTSHPPCIKAACLLVRQASIHPTGFEYGLHRSAGEDRMGQAAAVSAAPGRPPHPASPPAPGRAYAAR